MRIQGPRLLAAVSGMIAVAVGAILAVEAPSLVVEYRGEGYYSIGPVTPLPILQAFIVVLGLFTFASALTRHRFLSPLTAVCLGLFITSLTFAVRTDIGWRIDKFGYPLGWLAWLNPLPGMRPHIMGLIALPFLIDLAFWTLIIGAIIFAGHRLWSYFSGRRGMGKKMSRGIMHTHLKTAEASWLLAWMVIGGNPYWLISAVLTWVLLRRWVYG